MQKLLFLYLPIFFYCSIVCSQNLKLQYNQPASEWVEALPLGNSRLGIMVYGDPIHERLQLNEETVWAGSPYQNNNPEALKTLPQVRRLIFENKNEEAQTLIQKTFTTPHNGMPYQTIGSLHLHFEGHNNYTDYQRELDIERAVATIRYKVNEVSYTRELFTSFTDQVVIMHLSSDTPGSISFTANYSSPLQHTVSQKKNKLILSAQGGDHEGIPGKVRVENQVYVETAGGEVKIIDGKLTVTNATTATLYSSAATNFINYKDISGKEGRKAEGYIQAALKKPYGQALNDHVSYYQKLFNRVKLDLGKSDFINEETHLRVKHYNQRDDKHLAVLLFQFGRYLLISSSQPGGQPATLQGIWNDKVLPPWDSKYTININTEMNYWPAEVTNLSEMHEPLFDMIKDLAVTGQETARIMYGSKGWVTHHNTDLWRSTGPVDNPYYGMWPTGGAWLSQHLWQHYLYTGDIHFLKTIFPILKGAADFFLDYLVEHPDYTWMVVSPSNSPENKPKNRETTITAGCTMDNQIVFDVLSNALHANRIIQGEKTYEDQLQQMLDRLPPMQIGQFNQIQEWLEDLDDPQDQHRHVSHLYGLYPSNQISPYKSPELFQAAKNTLIYRGDQATGWSIGWKINFWARLLDGNHAYKIIRNMLVLLESEEKQEKRNPDGRTYPNLFDAHPPFQIDGNFGYTAGIAEMLLQSHDGAVHLLPALPDIWDKGEVSGLKTRGSFEVSMMWNGAQLLKTQIYSEIGGNLRLRSYVPLKGEGIKKAEGENPNPLFYTAHIKVPVVSPRLINPQVPVIFQIYEYDIETEAGKTYSFERTSNR